MNGNNGCRANTYYHRDESTAIERACLSEIIGPANAGPLASCDACEKIAIGFCKLVDNP